MQLILMSTKAGAMQTCFKVCDFCKDEFCYGDCLKFDYELHKVAWHCLMIGEAVKKFRGLVFIPNKEGGVKMNLKYIIDLNLGQTLRGRVQY